MKNKYAETGVNICDGTVRNQPNEMEFTDRKTKRKPTPAHKTEENEVKVD